MHDIKCPDCGSTEKREIRKERHIGLYCKDCDRWLMWKPGDVTLVKFWFGKYRGRKVGDVDKKELRDYANWLIKNKKHERCKFYKLGCRIDHHLKELGF